MRVDLGDGTAIAKIARQGTAAVERAALALLDGVVAPRMLAHGEGWILLEDLGPGEVLTPSGWRAALGEAVGTVHRRTVGLTWAQPAIEVDHVAFRWRRALRALPLGLARAGTPLRGAAERQLARVLGLIERPGTSRALVHGDLCPENTVVVNGRVRILDWEAAGPRHAALDVTPGTACWLRREIGDASPEADAEFFSGWERTFPEGLRDARAPAAAAVAWAAVAAHNLPHRLVTDDVVGVVSHRARIVGAFRGAAQRASTAFPALAERLSRAADDLGARWETPDVG